MVSKNIDLSKLSLSEIDNFVFDLDGTLLNSNSELINENLETIKKLQSLGKNIIIATGRPLYTAKRIIEQINTKFPVILANGALIWDVLNDRLFKSFAIEKSIAKSIYKKLNDENYEFLTYVPRYILGHNTFRTDFFKKKNYKERIGADHYIEGDLTNEIQNYDACKFYIVKESNNESKWKELQKFLKDINGIHALVSEWPNLDVMSNDASKGNALRFLFNKFNLDLSKTISFGDAENDVSMFSVTKFSGSFNNTRHKDVAAKAKIVFESNNIPWLTQFITKIQNNK
ncbi:haloacid dehalogenase [Mycoplasmopsis canis]|uniref:Cof-type HAD-IIB family hydrolase n=1 Tax=Mycoplasmopsis canis TaxID=29555 RepID=UPI000624DA74|nr:Cof-type HAD-IIB family hydrolase [Mycoplasmopsis canis]AKF41247.1 haloacid dehalogenase [Mycoplasmopsis canis]